jgi:hypothetical protein
MRVSLLVLVTGLVVGLIGLVGCQHANDADTDAGAPPDLDGVIFNHAYKCSETPSNGVDPWCPDPNGSEQIRFDATGVNTYDVVSVPDDGFVCSGTLDGLAFTWTAESPNGYGESGVWVFSADGTTFSGGSTYAAHDLSYVGACEGTGAVSPATPAEPAPVGTCS